MLYALLQRLAPVATIAGLAMLTPVSATADELRAVARYAVTLGGTQIATANVSLSDADGSYSLALESIGTSSAAGLKSQKFDMLTRANGEAFTVAVTFANGGVNSFIVDPPIINNIDRVAIERKHLTNSNDMAAPFLIKGGKLDASLCERQMPIFTGVERFNLTLRYAKYDVATSKRTGYQGPVVVCSVKYTPISGHYSTSEMTTYLSQSNRILIWYAPLETPGYFIPYRALITTEAGDLSVVLTELEQ